MSKVVEESMEYWGDWISEMGDGERKEDLFGL
jgi:hypothetical protein